MPPLSVQPPSSEEASENFDALGRRLGLDQSSLKHGYLDEYERNLAGVRAQAGAHVVLISSQEPANTAAAYAAHFEQATVHLLALSPVTQEGLARLPANVRFVDCAAGDSAVSSTLQRIPAPALIVEDGTHMRSSKLAAFKECFLFLKAGGIYLVEDLHACHMERFRDGEGENVWQFLVRLMEWKQLKREPKSAWSAEDTELAQAVERILVWSKVAFVEKSNDHHFKLRELGGIELLRLRNPGVQASERVVTPAARVTSKAAVWMNRPDLERRFPQQFDVPELRLREVSDVTCLPGQVAVAGSCLLPDTFRMHDRKRLANRHVVDAATSLARLKAPIKDVESWPGSYLYLDSELAGHYGHITLEVISRLWAWAPAREKYPDLRVLVGTNEKGELPSFTQKILKAFDIAEDRIRLLKRPARVERLVCATPQYHITSYAAPGLLGIWDTLARKLASPTATRHEKVFATRAPGGERTCRNQQLVEETFASHGFSIMRPELLPLEEQVALFANARVIAGFGGSATLNAIYSLRCEHKIIIGSETFDTKNDYLLSAIRGGTLSYFWCPSEVQHPPRSWSGAAFQSAFSFDEKDLPALEERLRAF